MGAVSQADVDSLRTVLAACRKDPALLHSQQLAFFKQFLVRPPAPWPRLPHSGLSAQASRSLLS